MARVRFVSRAVVSGRRDSAWEGWVEARAERRRGLERIGARSDVDFEGRVSGRKGEGRRGGGV